MEKHNKKLGFKSITKLQAEQQIGRVRSQLTYDNYDKVDVVIEAVLEKIDVKKQIIEDIQKYCKEDVIIASNTHHFRLPKCLNMRKILRM